LTLQRDAGVGIGTVGANIAHSKTARSSSRKYPKISVVGLGGFPKPVQSGLAPEFSQHPAHFFLALVKLDLDRGRAKPAPLVELIPRRGPVRLCRFIKIGKGPPGALLLGIHADTSHY
jgi:hypothetical protein